jgi:hypothetical protein
MKIRCAVNQSEALRQGVDAPKATVLIDVEPSTLSEYARDVIADKLVKGHDLTAFEPFHLIRATKDEFLEKVVGLDEELKSRTQEISKQVAAMLQAALKKNAGKITFVVAQRQPNGDITCFETGLPNNYRGPCGFWPFWDIAPDFDDLEYRSSLKRKFFQSAIDFALGSTTIAPELKAVSEKREKDRATAERTAIELLASSDKIRLKRLNRKGDSPWTQEEYQKGQICAWELDAFLADHEAYPAWTFEVPSGASLSSFVPASTLSPARIEPFLDALKQLPKGAEVWVNDDDMDAFLGRDKKEAFAAWREGELARFAFCNLSGS